MTQWQCFLRNSMTNQRENGCIYLSANARRCVGRQTQWQWWPRHKAMHFSCFGPEVCLYVAWPTVFLLWFSFASVFHWCCLTPKGSPGVGRNALFLSSPHLCVIIVFICDLFVSRDDHWWVRKPSRGPQNYVLSHDRSWGRGWDPV